MLPFWLIREDHYHEFFSNEEQRREDHVKYNSIFIRKEDIVRFVHSFGKWGQSFEVVFFRMNFEKIMNR